MVASAPYVGIRLEGVLQSEGTSSPIPHGVMLYKTLSLNYHVVVGIHQGTELAAAWMLRNGLREHEQVLYSPPSSPTPATDHLTVLRTQKRNVVLWVEADPAQYAAVMCAGVTALLFGSPTYARPEHRPDYAGEVTPWDSLVEQLDELADLRAKDLRLV